MKRNLARFLAIALALTMLLPGTSLSEEAAEHPVVCISVKGIGDIYAELYPEYAPITVENFLSLVDRGFYNGLTFHRIISGFMVQGGDPLGNGTGGSEKNIKGEFSSNGVDNPLTHERGVLSMARSQNMDSASSQFFIMHENSPHLNGSYAAFGRVLAGQWVVDRLCQDTPVQDRNGTVLKADQPVMEAVRRAERAEAEEALQKEMENGRAGSLFSDFCTPLSFIVPDGWNYVSSTSDTMLFQYENNKAKTLEISRSNQWGSLPQDYRAQLEQNGITRETLDTNGFKKEALLSLAGLEASSAKEETHSGVLFYTGEAAKDRAVASNFIGAKDGYLYLFSFSAGKTDVQFDDVLAILDQLAFREDF